MSPPLKPKIGQFYYDYPTASMRRWDGKKWAEISTEKATEEFKQVADQYEKK